MMMMKSRILALYSSAVVELKPGCVCISLEQFLWCRRRPRRAHKPPECSKGLWEMTGQNESTFTLNRKAIRAPLCSTQPLWIILSETPPDSFTAHSFRPQKWLMHETCHLYVNGNSIIYVSGGGVGRWVCGWQRCVSLRRSLMVISNHLPLFDSWLPDPSIIPSKLSSAVKKSDPRGWINLDSFVFCGIHKSASPSFLELYDEFKLCYLKWVNPFFMH